MAEYKKDGENEERYEDLIDIPLQPRKPAEPPEEQEEDPRMSMEANQVQEEAAQQEGHDDVGGQYSFLKFHMVEDENATDESLNNKSGDEGAGPNTHGAMR